MSKQKAPGNGQKEGNHGVSEKDQLELMESFSKPIQELDNALGKQHKEEQETMKSLIDATVKVEHDLKKAEQREQELHTEISLLKLDIETEKAKTNARDAKIKEMENEMIMLIVSKKNENKENRKGKIIEDVENKAEKIKSRYNTKDDVKDEPKLPYNEVYDQRIKNLNFRLRRLAADDEEKSERIVTLESQLEAAVTYASELEKEVDTSKIDEIKKRLSDKEKKKYVKYYDPANIVSSNKGAAQRSQVCVLQ